MERNKKSKLLEIAKWSIAPVLFGAGIGFMSSTDPQVRHPYLIGLATGVATYVVERVSYALSEIWEELENDPR